MARVPDGPARSNCLFWALWRLHRKGGYVAVRRSHHFRFLPHFLWSGTARIWWSYVPKNPREGKRVMGHAIRFAGMVEIERPRLMRMPAPEWSAEEIATLIRMRAAGVRMMEILPHLNGKSETQARTKIAELRLPDVRGRVSMPHRL